jgi:hypothetical protein
MATSKKAQSKSGVPARRRGQEMGDERSREDKTAKAKKQTPALRGRLRSASKFFADDSSQTIASGGDGSPGDNSPSVPAAVPTGEKLGESGGERSFARRQKARGKRQKAKGR